MHAYLLGDLVGSRRAEDRGDLHASLRRALDDVNTGLAPLRPARITVGDEFQGVFDSVRGAVRASLRVRLALLPAYDVRQGIGVGDVHELGDGIEDGPGWWSARAAVEQAESLSRRPATAATRTLLDPAADDAWSVNAALNCRDAVVSSLSDRSLLILRGLLAGRSQSDLADELGISTSAVSQRVRRDGLGMLVLGDDW